MRLVWLLQTDYEAHPVKLVPPKNLWGTVLEPQNLKTRGPNSPQDPVPDRLPCAHLASNCMPLMRESSLPTEPGPSILEGLCW